MPAVRARPAPIDVSTTALVAPSVSIVSPTPLAFTFASSTAPLASRSSSPFDGLKPFMIPATSAPGPRTPTPVSPASSDSPTFSSPSSSMISTPARSRTPHSPHSRSPSPLRTPTPAVKTVAVEAVATTAADADGVEPATGPVRRPKKGDEDYVKRPENAFILFRRKCVEERVQAQEATATTTSEGTSTEGTTAPNKVKKARQADLSKLISQQWRSLSAEERAHWESLAKEKKREHELAHPDYVYRPQRTKKAAPKSNPKKGKGRADPEPEPAPESVSFLLPLPPSPTSRHGRSSSAPSARFGPSAAMIRLPVVTMPSMPTSPLDHTTPDLPMPARRFSYDWPHPAEPHFDPTGIPMQAQPMFEPIMYYQWDAPVQPQVLPPLFMPQEPAMYSSGPSPAETASPATPYPGPFAAPQPVPQVWQAEPSDVAMVPFDIEAELPALCDIPWTHEFVGEFVPGGLLSDGDFDLATIAPVTLDELCERKGGAWDLSALDLGAGAVPTTGQDPLEYFLHDPAGAGRF